MNCRPSASYVIGVAIAIVIDAIPVLSPGGVDQVGWVQHLVRTIPELRNEQNGDLLKMQAATKLT